jgi:hypothetical protein
MRHLHILWRAPVTLLLVWASGDWFDGHHWRETWEMLR